MTALCYLIQAGGAKGPSEDRRAGMTLTPLAAFAWGRLIAAELADAHSFGVGPNPAFDLDAELRSIRELAFDLLRDDR